MNETLLKKLAKPMLVCAPLIWGSTFFMIKDALDDIDGMFMLAFRFSLAALLLAAVFWRRWKDMDLAYLWQGSVLGLLMGAAYILQTFGLMGTTPGKNAFFTAVYCVIVPFLYWAVDRKRPTRWNVLAALMSVTGIGLVSWDGGGLALALGENPSAGIDLPGGRAYRQYELLVFSPAGEPEPPAPEPLREGEGRWGNWRIRCMPATCPQKAYISPWEFYLRPGEYFIRSRREGDTLTLGKRPAKTVKKLMIEGKVPARRREHIPVLALGDRVAAVGGLGPERDCLAEPGAPALHIMIKTEESVL